MIPMFCFHTLTISWDSTFAFESDLEPPDPLLSFIRLLMLPQDEWEKIKKKGKPPKPKTDAVALGLVCDVLVKRLDLYSTTIQVCDLQRITSQYDMLKYIRWTKICLKVTLYP